MKYKTIIFNAFIFLITTLLIYLFIPLKSHWPFIFRPAAIEFIAGRSPYTVTNFVNPPWALIPLVPLALLPVKLGSAILSAVTLYVYAAVAVRMGARWWTVVMLLTLPNTFYNAIQVNVDWLVVLGFILPSRWGLFLILLKPQIGAPLALFWMVEAWRAGGVTRVARTFGPVGCAFLVSFAFYGVYLVGAQPMVLEGGKTFWPASIPFGLAMLVASIRRKWKGGSILSAPLLAPYMQPYSWGTALFGLLPYPLETAAAVAGLWVVWFAHPFIEYYNYFRL